MLTNGYRRIVWNSVEDYLNWRLHIEFGVPVIDQMNTLGYREVRLNDAVLFGL